MLDIKKIRESFDEIKKSVESRGQGDYEIGRVLSS
jgi:seryl-tRNA synthetase